MSTPANLDNGAITTPLNEPNPDPVGKRYVLDEQRRTFDQVADSGEALDRKLQALLGSASLIISLVGTIQLVALRQTGGLVFWAFVVPELVLFIVMVILIVRGLRPLVYLNPIADNWRELAILFFDEPEDRVLGTLIYNYLNVIEKNRASNATKTRAVMWATRTFMAIVIVGVLSI